MKVGAESPGPRADTAIHQDCSPDRPEALACRNIRTSRMRMYERHMVRLANVTQSRLSVMAWRHLSSH